MSGLMCVFLVFVLLTQTILNTALNILPEQTQCFTRKYDSLSKMIYEIISQYFIEQPCMVFITETKQFALKYTIKEFPVYMFVLSQNNIEKSNNRGQEISFNDYPANEIERNTTLDQFLLHTLNKGCIGNILQISNPIYIIRRIYYLMRKSQVRKNRKFIFLPSGKFLCGDDEILGKLLLMREMDFMPDVLFVKFSNHHLTEKELNSDEMLYTSKNVLASKFPTSTTKLSTPQSKPIIDISKENISNKLFVKSKNSTERKFPKPKVTNGTVVIGFSDAINLTYNDDKTEYFNVNQTIKKTNVKVQEKTKIIEHFEGLNVYGYKEETSFVFMLTTHTFVGPAPSQELLLDIWLTEGNRFLYSNNLFPDKTSNVMGKELTVVSFTYLPYTIVDNSTNPISYEGTEFRLINELARHINFTCKAVIDDVDLWGEIWENGSGNGVMGSISEDKFDMGVAALYLWYNEYKYIDFTFPYYASAITCLVPKPKQLPAWMLLILPFSLNMWVAVAASLGVATVSLYLVGKASFSYLDLSLEERNRNPYSNLWKSLFLTLGYVLQQSPADVKDPQAPQNTPLRQLITWLFVVFLLVASVYSGGLASILTVPKFEPPIDTKSDLARSGKLWAAPHEAWIFSIKYANDPELKTIIRNFRVYSFDEMHRKSTTGELAFGVERLPGGHLSLMSYLQEESISTLRLMKGDLYGDHVGLAMRKGSPYMDKMNQLIHRLLVSGILLRWEEEVVRTYMSNRLQVAALNSAIVVNDGPTKLRIEHIESAIFLLLFGLLFSLIAFVLEILMQKYRGTHIRIFKKKKKVFVRTRVSNVPRILRPARKVILVKKFRAYHGESEDRGHGGCFIYVNQKY